MSCEVGEVTERLENEQSSFSKLSVTSPTSQLILQPFRRFTYVTANSPTLPLLHLRHSSFSYPSFASPTSQALHLIYLASRPCSEQAAGLVLLHSNSRHDGQHISCRSSAGSCSIIHPITRTSRPVISIFSYTSKNFSMLSVRVFSITERRK